MKFRSEDEFERHVRKLIASEVATPSSDLTLLKYKGIADIVICRDNSSPAVFFIELKYAKDMIGVAEKIQSEILLKRPHYMENHFMWLIGSQDHEGECWFLNSEDLRKYVPKVDVDKENNISRHILRHQGKHKCSEEDLIGRLREWLEQTS